MYMKPLAELRYAETEIVVLVLAEIDAVIEGAAVKGTSSVSYD